MSVISCECNVDCMAYLQFTSVLDKRAIVPALWPSGLGRCESGGFEWQVSNDWRHVPETFDELCDWATVVRENEEEESIRRRRCHLVYQPNVLPEDRRGKRFNVSLVLQGFLGEFNISVLGTWNKCVRLFIQ